MTPEPPPRAPGHQRKYSTATMQLARTMYADGDAWTPTQIMRYLREQGYLVSLTTVRRWVVPGYADDHRRRLAEDYRRRKAQAASVSDDERAPAPLTPLERMLTLRGEGMSYSAIAIVLRLDWGIDANAERVRYCCQHALCPTAPPRKGGRGRPPRRWAPVGDGSWE